MTIPILLAVVLLQGPVDATPDPAFVNRVRVDVVGCESLVDHDCGRLAHFRFAYAWESSVELERRLAAGAQAAGLTMVWTLTETDAKARAGLPLPPDTTSRNLLHVRLEESGWDWFTFPGPHLVGTLEGSNAFELQPGQTAVRVTLVRAPAEP